MSSMQVEAVEGSEDGEAQAALAELREKMGQLAAAEAAAAQRSPQAESSSKDVPDDLQLASIVDRQGFDCRLMKRQNA